MDYQVVEDEKVIKVLN